VAPLLKDPKPTVRLHAALGMAHNHDAGVIPIVIELLADLPPGSRKHAEEFLQRLAGTWTVAVPEGPEKMLGAIRRDVWAAWWSAISDSSLLAELRKRTLAEPEREQALQWIRQLGDTDPAVREKASNSLVTRGVAVAPLLHQALEASDLSVRLHAGQCLRLLEKDGAGPLPAVVLRLLAVRKPEGTTEALLAYLPFAENKGLVEETQGALAAAAFANGRAESGLVKALVDPLGIRRAAAAEALCRAGLGEQHEAVRRLLQDPEPLVRLRTALALAAAKDKQAIPVLIALLSELPSDQRWPAEEYLALVAGDKAPGPAGAEPDARRKYRDAWAAWWKQQGDNIDLEHLDLTQRMLGYTVVIEQYDHNKRASRLVEVDSAGKIRLQIEGLQYAWDAQVLPGDRVLVTEQMTSRVTERDAKGDVLWQKNVSSPFACERLRNGHTFIAARSQLMEVDRDGKEVVSYNRANNDIASAARLRNGQFAFVTYQGMYIRVDGAGKEVKSVRVPFTTNMNNQVEFLPNDHLLAALYHNNRVAEYDLEGKLIWEATVPAPSSASRLPNGNTLVVSAGQRVVELNRTGQTVWELKENLRPWRARRR
jgi:HEAT repeat protein